MYICEKCGKEVNETFGSGRFCSQSCANSRQRPQEVKDKISLALKGRPATSGAFKKVIRELEIENKQLSKPQILGK